MVGQNEAHRPDDVRCQRPEHFTLHQRFAHQAKLIMFEIAQAAVDELGRSRRRAGGKVVHLGKRNRVSPTDRITRDAASVDAVADNEDVEDCLLCHCFSPPTFRNAQIGAIAKAKSVKAKTYRMSNECWANLRIV
ncbi:hypothetical protein D3C87_1573730 [compost metagenome]